ncbi:MAG: IS66 family transposase [Actinobacteria bacterium]|nr:IS66 family transposase [Actinomycetota bacterium]
MKRKDIIKVYNAGPEAVIALVEGLVKIIDRQGEDIADLKKRIKALEDRLSQNSTNSNRPPSSDWPTKKRSLRKKTGRSPGGQKGHKGSNLKMVEGPDSINVIGVSSCSGCGRSLKGIEPAGYSKRQVFDLPSIKIRVEEFRAEQKCCPHCGHLNQAPFPEGVDQPAQYGPRIKAYAVYLNQYQLLPYDRIRELFLDLFGTTLSAGTIVNANRVCYECLKPVEEAIKDKITACRIVHFDETGLYTEANRWWLHVAATDDLTYYRCHPKRGASATDYIDILPGFNGVAIHDGWDSYFKYKCRHGLCNAHHLRELKAIEEFSKKKWASDMASLLVEIKEAVDKKRDIADRLEKDEIDGFKDRYDKIIARGLAQNPPVKKRDGPNMRGRLKQSKATNLLLRLKKYWKETLSFMYDFDIPFDNSQAERDIRMAKVQQKISGTFRSADGARTFCRIRGYISTARKNCLSVIDAIQAAFEGKPFIIPALS